MNVRHVMRVSIPISVLAVAAIAIYGYLFGLQRPNIESTSGGASEMLYFVIIAVIAGAVATIVATRGLMSARSTWGHTISHGAALGIVAGAATGGLIVVWQLLFGAVVNVLLQRPGLFTIPSSTPHTSPENAEALLIGTILDLTFTLIYSLIEGLIAMASACWLAV